MPASLDGLDRAQLAAVTHRGGPLLILGGPGTGKTHVLARRAAWLVEEGTAAESVLVLAPTAAAAADLRQRLETLIDTPYDELSVFGAQELCERISFGSFFKGIHKPKEMRGPGALTLMTAAEKPGQARPYDDEIDEDGGGENAVGDEIAALPVESRADQRADDHQRQTLLRIEILARVEVAAGTDRAAIDGAILADSVAELQRNFPAASTAADRLRRRRGVDRQRRVALRTLDDELHHTGTCVASRMYFASTSPTTTVKKST
jgi:hypothetical protein